MRRIVILTLQCIILCGCLGNSKEVKLIEAAGAGDLKGIETLLERGANINGKALDDWTPLTRAADAGQLEVVRLLIEKGAKVNLKRGDLTPVYFAAWHNHVEVVRYLIQHGGKLDLPPDLREYFAARVKTSLSVILCARHNEREGAYYAEQSEAGCP